MNFDKDLIKKLQINNIDFRIVKKEENLLEDPNIKVGEEGHLTIIRIADNSPNPLDLYLTTKCKIKCYNKNGELLNIVDDIYYDTKDLLKFLKEY